MVGFELCAAISLIFLIPLVSVRRTELRGRVKMETPSRKLLQLTSQELRQAWNRLVAGGVVRRGNSLDIVLDLILQTLDRRTF